MPPITPTKSVLEIAARLERAGFQAWCVGGAIRDALLGGAPLDWDIATTARPEQVQELFGRKRTIPVGIEFGTVAVLDPDGVPHEITTFRRDIKTDGRHAVVEFGASLDDDLARRDFTINAIAYRPATSELRDPFHGQQDIQNRIVRAVGDADARMLEDRLRALRAIRFAARYDFQIDPATRRAIHASAPFLTRLSAERVQQELVKTMEQVVQPSAALAEWRDSGALRSLVPSLAGVTDLTLRTLDFLPVQRLGVRDSQRTWNRISALFLDVSSAQARVALSELRFPKHTISWAGALVGAWQTLGAQASEALMGGEVPDRRVRRWLAATGRLRSGAFMRVAAARWCAMRAAGQPAPSERAVRSLHRSVVRARFGPVEISDLAIGGDELRASGIPPGPLYGKILGALLDRVLEEPERNTPQRLLADLPALAAALGHGQESLP